MINHDALHLGSGPNLRARFASALRNAGADSDGTAVFHDLAARYGEDHRRYHTLAHVDACLGWLDWVTGHAERPEEVELALWFHDVVYDPGSIDNERHSAEVARKHLRHIGVPEPTIERIGHHIMATTHHVATTGDTSLVVDIDLTTLAANPDEFVVFEEQIRREYAHVQEGAYRKGRRRVLEMFVTRPQLYSTNALSDLLEVRARANLERRIAELSCDGGES